MTLSIAESCLRARSNAGVLAVALALGVAAGSAQAATVQVGFSPEGSASTLVMSVIGSAKHEIRMLGYAFTSRDIARALIAAKQRGVDVQVVLDAGENSNRASWTALNLIATAGIPVRLDSAYRIQHDKTIIADRQTVETGSFNYTASAERSNSEDALVIWNYPQIAAPYLEHWRSRWNQATPYQSSH